MRRVAEYLRAGSHHQALVRLARLANTVDAEGLVVLGRWERQAHDETAAAQAYFHIEAECGLPLASRSSTGNTCALLEKAPLAWLQALDSFCRHDYPLEVFAAPLRIDDGGDTCWLIPCPPGAIAGALAGQFNKLQRWVRWHRIVPCRVASLPLACPDFPPGYLDLLADRFAGNRVRVALACFDDGISLQWSPVEPAHFRVTGLDNESARREAALSLLREARESDAHILVLPELTIPAPLSAEIGDLMYEQYEAEESGHDLDIPLVMLGSFHEGIGTRWRNHGQLLTGIDGTRLLGTDKRSPVTFSTPAQALCEDISAAPEPFSMLLTPIGLIALAICKDFFDGHVALALRQTGPDWVLVPSMSDRLTPHEQAGDWLGKCHGSRVVVANQPMPGTASAKHGFLQDGPELIDARCEVPGLRLHLFDIEAPQSTPPAHLRIVK